MKIFLTKWCAFFTIIFGVVAYYETQIGNRISGDLGVLGRIPFGTDYNTQTQAFVPNLSLYHLVDIDSASTYPILMIGDSFTEPSFGLTQAISQELADTVRLINCVTTDNYYRPTRVLLYGLTHKCFRPGQIIILETVEHFLVERFCTHNFIDTERPDNLRQAYSWYYIQSYFILTGQSPAQALAQDANHSIWPWQSIDLNNILTWLRVYKDYDNPVKTTKLIKPMFTHEKFASDLFYYIGDNAAIDVPKEQIDSTALNIDRMIHMAEEQGINLYFLSIPNKYDFFYPYFADKTMPKPNMLTCLDQVKSNSVINAHDSLARLLEQNEKDLWRINDSHWGIKAATFIGKEVANRIKTDQNTRKTSEQ